MPKATLKASPRAKRAKAEIQEEFSEIQDEMRAFRDSADPKADELARHKESDVRTSVEGVSVDGVVEQISKLGLYLPRLEWHFRETGGGSEPARDFAHGRRPRATGT